MNKYLHQYFQSFDPNRKHLISIITDALLFGILLISFLLFTNYVQDSVYGLNSITHPDYIQQRLSEMTSAEVQAFVVEMRTFLYGFVGGTFFLVLMTIFLFSLSNSVLWKKLLHQQFTWKTIPRWMGLTCFLILLLIIFLLITLVLRVVLTYFFTRITTNELALSVFNNALSIGMLLIFVLFIFLTFYHLAKDNVVFNSIGKAFKMMKKKFWILFLLAWITAHIPLVIALPFDNVLRFNQPLLKVLAVMITLIYLTWLRIYLLKSVESEHLK